MSQEYTEAHRVFLTYIRGVKSVSADELLEKFLILAEHFGIDTREPVNAMRDFIAAINVKIARAYFKIDSIRDQDTDEQIYVFINTRSDDIIQACSPYSAPELNIIKQLIDNIVNAHAYAYAIPFVNAKQHVATLLTIKLNELEFFIRRLVDDGWINLTEQNRLVLSATTLAELANYLKDRFGVFSAADTQGKLLQCHVCSGFVTLGKKCSNSECPSAFHSKCLGVFSRNNQTCPNEACNKQLAAVIDVGTKSAVGESRH